MNQSPDRGAVCEIALKDGRTCGVQAIGRCATCERAFCLATSQMEAQERAARYLQEQNEMERKLREPIEQLQDYFLSGAARTALRKLPRVPVYTMETSVKQGFIGSRRIETLVSTRYGWCIGILEWRYKAQYDVIQEKKFLTVMLDQEIQPEQRYQIGSFAFAAVEPYRDGYKEYVITTPKGPLPRYDYVLLEDAEKAVKRIASKSR